MNLQALVGVDLVCASPSLLVCIFVEMRLSSVGSVSLVYFCVFCLFFLPLRTSTVNRLPLLSFFLFFSVLLGKCLYGRTWRASAF